MENRKEQRKGRMSVPAFGDWDHDNVLPDYSLDFSKIRETRKQNKMDISRASVGKEDDDLIPHQHHQSHSHSRSNRSPAPTVDLHRPHQFHQHDHSPAGRKKFMSYFHCCIRA